MKNKHINERKQFMKIAGLLKEDVDVNIDDNGTPNDYNMGTPSGDTDAMGGISEYGPSSVQNIGAAIDVVANALDYVERFADTDDEADEEGSYGMNEAGRLAQSLEDLYTFLQSMNKNG